MGGDVNGKVLNAAKGDDPPPELSHYKMGRTLGAGSFGKVKMATHKLTGHNVAIKIMQRRSIASSGLDDKGAKCSHRCIDDELANMPCSATRTIGHR